jgi:urea transport system substrate-binding protein
LIDWAVPSLGKKIYIIGADYNAPHATATFVEQYAKEDGGQVVAQEYYPFEVSDFGDAISKIQAAKPDIIYSMLIGAPHLGFYRQWAASGMKDKIPIISHFFGGGNEEVLLTPEEGNGIVSCYGYWEDIDSPANKEFLARFTKRWGVDHPYINAIGMGAYEGTKMWWLGVEKAGTVERTKVIEALRSGIASDGPSGHIAIDPKTNHAVRDVYIARAKNRRMEIVKKVPQMAPLFTQQHCDLVAHPETDKQYLP